jgi:fructose-1,6-bisphosphatase I
LALAGKLIARDIRSAGFLGLLGNAGGTNVQGEVVQKLDERANEIFVEVFKGYGGLVRLLVSEELEQPCAVSAIDGLAAVGGPYAVFIDPLDGSSNVDINATVGSIFSIHRVGAQATPASLQELLKLGTEQVAAGYVLYGPYTLLVYTCGQGVHQFTLDQEIGEFLLTQESITMPVHGTVYSVNEANYRKWTRGAQKFLDALRSPDPAWGRSYSARYSGCLVADIHRLLTSGGVYLYPAEVNKPEGKLRLMYEGSPLGFLVEQAGGAASTGVQRMLEVQPTHIHDRVSVFIGSREEIQLAEQCLTVI